MEKFYVSLLFTNTIRDVMGKSQMKQRIYDFFFDDGEKYSINFNRICHRFLTEMGILISP